MGNPPVFFFFLRGVVHILIAMYQYFGAGGNPQITLATLLPILLYYTLRLIMLYDPQMIFAICYYYNTVRVD